MQSFWNSPLLLLLRNALWTLLLPGMVAGYIPGRVFGFRLRDAAGASGVLGIGILLVGIAILVVCIAEFARRGRGTLSPLDPTRRLVVTGPYRWVRNPMYVGVLLILAGEALVSRSPDIALYTLGFFVFANLFILGFEEPYLAKSFGASYAEYKKHVRRWVPRRRPRTPGLRDQGVGGNS